MHLPIHLGVDVSLAEKHVDFRCSRCGVLMTASVSGGGTGLKLYGVPVSSADADARVAAAHAAQLAPCPRCGRRGVAAVLKVLLAAAPLGLVAALASGFSVADRLYGSDPDGNLGRLVGVATFLAVIVASAALKLGSARRRVRFHDPVH